MQRSVHLLSTVVAESIPRAFVAVQLYLAHVVSPFDIFKYCVSQRTFCRSQGLQEIVGLGFPSTWQKSDVVSPRPTKNFSASLTLGETVSK